VVTTPLRDRVSVYEAARAMMWGVTEGSLIQPVDGVPFRQINAEIPDSTGVSTGSTWEGEPLFTMNLWLFSGGPRFAYVDGRALPVTRDPDTVVALDREGWRITAGLGEGLHGAWTVETIHNIPTATNAQAAGYALADILLNVLEGKA
jgi:hypothetical protein